MVTTSHVDPGEGVEEEASQSFAKATDRKRKSGLIIKFTRTMLQCRSVPKHTLLTVRGLW
jgi:hypothetical protein